MITIIHGDDIVSSRNYLLEEKQKNKNSISLEGKKVTTTDLAQNIQGSGLFSDTKTIFIESFLTGVKKTSKDAKEIIDFIVKNHKSSEIFLWESKEFSKRELMIFKDAIIKNFRLPKSIFLFLDSIRPNNFKNIISLFRQTLEAGVKEELIFFMIQRQFRFLLSLCHLLSLAPEPWPERSEGSHFVRDSSPLAQNDNGTIDELMRLAPWQRGKLERQASLFSQNQLKRIYNNIYRIESGFKTGRLNLTLPQAIDFLLYEI